MHARVVRFTDVSRDRIDGIKREIEESGGPPPGVDAKAIRVMYDGGQSTAVVVIFFEDEEALRAASETFDQMDASETPGSRASVDLCEVVSEIDV